jgi:hypothetical protein
VRFVTHATRQDLQLRIYIDQVDALRIADD